MLFPTRIERIYTLFYVFFIENTLGLRQRKPCLHPLWRAYKKVTDFEAYKTSVAFTCKSPWLRLFNQVYLYYDLLSLIKLQKIKDLWFRKEMHLYLVRNTHALSNQKKKWVLSVKSPFQNCEIVGQILKGRKNGDLKGVRKVGMAVQTILPKAQLLKISLQENWFSCCCGWWRWWWFWHW